ncbi:MAG: undecaprenyl/decaprenyl-phosphate alpha-N-acetylglucosaminyl 1-phosphate transferase [Abitibacteriaceae bacterium]|nr:undecaprenyl/decaprenyl-phosphate alpha-N-acetylglucosaminyl 1-phosphate transferase [Abditibacteriaceae bacterium]
MLELIKGSPFVAFVAAFIATLLVTPWVKVLAWRCNALARPDARRTHPEPIAQWGGIAIFMGVAIAALFWRQPAGPDIRLLAPSGTPQDVANTAQTLHLSTVFFGCGFLMLLWGMLDDRFELKPVLKFGGQIVIAYLLWRGGVRIRTLPFSSGTQSLSDTASLAWTMFWVLGLTNGVNFIDGVDGLAAGVCAIAAGSLSIIEILKDAPWAAGAAAAVCGASLAFLRYNFPPAKIFLGDAGALLLGFWLAAIGVAAAAKTAAATTLALPMLILGVPVVDTLWAVTRRTLARQPMWHADRGHLHHRLLARGFSPRKTVLVLYAISAALGAAAMMWVKVRG